MKLDKLVKQLRRDLLANRKKAAILGLMVLVALYFWAPLAWKWIAPTGKKTAKADASSLILEDDPAEPKATKRSGSAATFKWEKVRDLMANDSRMASAAFNAAWRDPFAVPITELPPVETTPTTTPGTETERAVATSAPAKSEAEQIGLKLASVAIGPRGRSAIISGETYREGETIRIKGNESGVPTAEFVVVRIDRQGVEIERAGRTLRLEFEKSKLAHGDEFGRATASGPK